ncbi:MAG: NAD(P)H-binding protein, partial [Anaerolineae bacterium]|nr:NAD(P)H-binding protein [Anaerolineae bacterium]
MEFRTVDPPRILITGATGFLGFRVVAALLEGGASVTVIVRSDQTEKVAAIANRVRVVEGDIWNRASLKGLARGHHALVHLVGSVRSDPSRGLTYQQINLVSARHVIGMAVSDGVPNFVLLSAAGLLLPTEYIRSKRDAEEYLKNSGLEWVIVRMPLLFESSFWNRPLLTTLSTIGVLP